MQHRYSWLFAALFFWTACSKEPAPPGASEDPVFSAQFQVASEEKNLVAGQDSIYLFTKYETVSQAIVCSGSFSPVDCPAALCPGSLSFEFRNDRIGAQVFVDSIFAIGPRSYWGPGTPVGDSIVRITFSTSDTVDYQLFQWFVDNDAPVSAPKITKEYSGAAPHEVRLLAYRGGELRSTVARTIAADTLSDIYPAAGIEVVNTGSQFLLNANTFGTPVADYHWSTGDSTEQIDESPLDSSYSLRVQNAAGDTAFARINTINANQFISKTADFTYTVQLIPPFLDTLQLGTVNIRWVDDNGIVWVVNRGPQGPGAYFEILASEDYERNENGQPTRKMTVSFSCILYNTNNPAQSRSLSGTAIIAVAYPD